ncbi:uncharacterized protein [Apostichopus japonicus]|uniref:uncharacterized protein n=1 Tax=Stichopus japonicus TaxID=307972 RepID=UPI003AB34764
MFKSSDYVVQSVNLLGSDTIEMLTQIICQRVFILPKQQQLKKNGQILEHSKTLSKSNLKNGDIIFVDILPLCKITINTGKGHKPVTVEVLPNDTISEVKDHLQKESGLSMYNRCLIHEGAVLEEHKSVDDYNIKDGSILFLFQRPPELVALTFQRTSGEVSELKFNPRDPDSVQSTIQNIIKDENESASKSHVYECKQF